MAAFWNSIYDPDSVGVTESSHDKEDIKHCVQDKWDDLEYARETVYGIVATCAMGHMVDIEFQGTFHARYTHNCEKHKDSSLGMSVSYTLPENLVCMDPASLHFHHATNTRAKRI